MTGAVLRDREIDPVSPINQEKFPVADLRPMVRGGKMIRWESAFIASER